MCILENCVVRISTKCKLITVTHNDDILKISSTYSGLYSDESINPSAHVACPRIETGRDATQCDPINRFVWQKTSENYFCQHACDWPPKRNFKRQSHHCLSWSTMFWNSCFAQRVKGMTNACSFRKVESFVQWLHQNHTCHYCLSTMAATTRKPSNPTHQTYDISPAFQNGLMFKFKKWSPLQHPIVSVFVHFSQLLNGLLPSSCHKPTCMHGQLSLQTYCKWCSPSLNLFLITCKNIETSGLYSRYVAIQNFLD